MRVRVSRPAALTVLAIAAFTRPAAGGAAPEYGASGIDLSARDLSVRPGDDFDSYASGAWRRDTTIPPDRSEVGPFQDVEDRTEYRLRAMLSAAATAPTNATTRKIGNLYAAYMDEERLAQLDSKPLDAGLAAIREATNKSEVAQLMGRTQGGFGKSFFHADVRVDSIDPTQHVARLQQDGLGMADREMYLSANFAKQRREYREYVARTLRLIGWADADAQAEQILQMETRIAQASWPVAESRDRSKTYNPVSASALLRLAPGFPWAAYLNGARLDGLTTVIAAQKTAFPKIAAVFENTPLATLKAWLAFQTVDQASPYLSRRFDEDQFAYRGKVEQGLQQQLPRWRRAVDTVNAAMDMAVGREYVAKFFPARNRQEMQALAANLKAAMAGRIRRVSWMSPRTKAAALAKLAQLRVMVGYPDEWRDYSELQVDRHDLYGDVVRAKAFEWARQVAKLRKGVDRGEWLEPPQMVDAYSDYSRVAIVFPAGILQPPFFDPDADPASSYGAIGAVIGHEITHQFDDQGRKYDARGALRDWWVPEDAVRFENAVRQLIAQYNAYQVAPGIHNTGKQTLGENIGDLGGLLVALDAYHASLGAKPAPVVDGLTGDQRVFLGWAQFFRSKERPETQKEAAVAGVHSLPRFRVIGATRNIDAWYEAYGVKPSDRYYLSPPSRVRIW